MSRFYVVSPFKILFWTFFASLRRQATSRPSLRRCLRATRRAAASVCWPYLPRRFTTRPRKRWSRRAEWRPQSPARLWWVYHFHVTTLGKLFTHMRFCHRAVQCGTGRRRAVEVWNFSQVRFVKTQRIPISLTLNLTLTLIYRTLCM